MHRIARCNTASHEQRFAGLQLFFAVVLRNCTAVYVIYFSSVHIKRPSPVLPSSAVLQSSKQYRYHAGCGNKETEPRIHQFYNLTSPSLPKLSRGIHYTDTSLTVPWVLRLSEH